MKHRSRSLTGFYTIGIAALFLVGFLLLVLFGARSYRNAAAGQAHNNDTRALLSYVSARVHAGDEQGAVHIEQAENSSVLCIADAGLSTGFETRIYLNGTTLMEEYAAVDAPLSPELAQPIGTTEVFWAEAAAEDLLRIQTDAGTISIHLRSEGGLS